MRIWKQPEAFRQACEEARAGGRTVGLVPTMGALHEGHLALVAEARRRASFVAVTVFVNPTQFGPSEDFARYPRNLERDARLAAGAGADGVFAPEAEAMYPPGDEIRVRPGGLAEHLCGPRRPGHFEGVATVVAKLFALAGRATAVFGRKDYQQLQVVRRLASDLFFPVEVIGLPTVREADGLAMSSRNAYLSPEERKAAGTIPRGLAAAARAHAAGERRAGALRGLVRAELAGRISAEEYVEVADASSLVPFPEDGSVPDRALVALAVRVGRTRLIDNLVLGEDAPPG